MNYYEQLEKIVSPHLKSYREDLTTHDRTNLEGYEGRFFYEYRPSGTCLFRVDYYINALREVLKNGKSDCFNKKAHIEALKGTFSLLDTHAYASVVHNWDHDDRYLIGENGRIRRSTLEEIKTKVAQIDRTEVRPLVSAIKAKWGYTISDFYPAPYGLMAIY